MQLSKSKLIILGPEGVKLAVWGVFDPEGPMGGILTEAGGGMQIEYKKMNEATYEEELVNALAAGRGPDVFMFHNTWLPKHFDKIVPVPEAMFPILEFRGLFPTVVEQDFAPDGAIYASPLYLDTLAMLYNQDMFDRKGVALPPKTWVEFQDVIPRLREADAATGEIKKAAAAIGGSSASVNRATDLLSLLMLQSGVEMTNPNFTATTFADAAGVRTLLFYTKFANPGEREAYTWNDSMRYSLDAFAEEDAAIIFNYHYQLGILKEKNPFLRIGVASMPQVTASQEVNYANYWGLAVSNRSEHQLEAWFLVKNFTTNPDLIKKYLEAAKHPPALRSVIQELQGDPEWDVFARQALTARSWPQIDNNAVEREFGNAVAGILTGRLAPEAALSQAQSVLSGLIERRKKL